MPAPVPYRIRPAGPDDAGALALVGAASFLETYAGVVDGPAMVEFCARHHSADAYRAYFARGAQAWLAEIEPGDAPIGYALACEPALEQARTGDHELRRIYSLSRFHGSGLGAALMDTVIAAAAGHIRLLLGVKNDNHRAIAFYRKHGFAVVGTRTFTVGAKTYDDFVLARALAPELTETR